MTILYLALHLLALEPAVFVCPNTLLELGRERRQLLHCPLSVEVFSKTRFDV